MTPELHAMLTAWLESGTDAQKLHAANRLSLPDATGYEPPAAPAYPSVLAMAGNAVSAAAAFVADGFAVVDQAEQDRRMGLCRNCPHFDPQQERCVKCGCIAGLKTRIASQHCPDDPPRW